MKNPPVILAIDTTLGPCSVAILREGRVVAEKREETPGRQSRVLVSMIESTLYNAKLGYRNLDAIACTLGPGGFTAIRVGLSTARAIALATNKPLIGLSTLEVIAYASQVRGDVVAVIDAHRGQLYAQRFRMNGELLAQSDPLLVEEKAVTALAHGAKTARDALHARDVAMLAAQKWAAGERNFPAVPLYIREPDAKLPSTEGLKCSGELI